MKAKVILNDSEICEEYINNEEGIETLALKHHVGKKRIREILERNNITIKKKGNQGFKYDYVVEDCHIEKYPQPDNMTHYVVYDEKTDFESIDIGNRGGVLTSYIEQEYGIPTPSLHERQMYYRRTGNYWWEQWLKVKLVKDKETKKCPYCDWTTTDLDNKSGAFEVHLRNVHKMTKFQYLEEHPEERGYFALVNKSLDRSMETDTDKFVVCQVCGEKLARIDNVHLKKHGMDKRRYKELYDTPLLSNEFHDLLVKQVASVNENMTFKRQSSAELEIMEFIKSLGFDCYADRKILKGKELDIYIPSRNIAIEYDGNMWHTEKYGKDRNYHLNKTNECNKLGIGLIHICDDEFIHHKNLVLSKIRHLLNVKTEGQTVIPGRKCTITEICKDVAKIFLETNHIQGFANSTLYLGAYYNNELVGVMTFIEETPGRWNLTRYASLYNAVCQGVGGKLFKHFIRNYNVEEVKTFADRRWTMWAEDNLYTKLGFKMVQTMKPDYYYYNKKVDGTKRFHKFGFRKQILHKKYGLPLTMTETEMTRKLGYDRVWNCGLFKYVWKKGGNNNE